MKRLSWIDAYVGSRVRLRRLTLGISQQGIADKLGVTFQQLQKYEKGSNRISASRLYDLADVLSVPIQFFFQGADGQSHNPDPELALTRPEALMIDLVSSKEGIELNQAFSRIVDTRTRRGVLKLLDALAPPDVSK